MLNNQLHKPICYAGLAFCLLTVLAFGLYASKRAGTDWRTYGNDFTVFYTAAYSALETNGNPYTIKISDKTPYLYLPLFAQMISPLALLPLPAAAFLWYLANVAALVVTLILPGRLFKHDLRTGIVVALIAFALTARFIIDNLLMGQVNIVITFLVVASLYLLNRERILLSALSLALAISFKLTPGLFLLYHLFKRRLKYSALTIGLLLVLNLFSFAVMGATAPDALTGWYQRTILNGQGFDWAYCGNQSLRGFLERTLTDSYTGTGEAPRVNLVNIDKSWLSILWMLGVATVVGVIAIFSSSSNSQSKSLSNLQAASEWGTVSCGMLLISNLSWKAHFVGLILPYVVLVECYRSLKREGARRVLLVVIGASFALCSLTSIGIVGLRLNHIAESYSCVLAGAVILFIGLLFVRRRL